MKVHKNRLFSSNISQRIAIPSCFHCWKDKALPFSPIYHFTKQTDLSLKRFIFTFSTKQAYKTHYIDTYTNTRAFSFSLAICK